MNKNDDIKRVPGQCVRPRGCSGQGPGSPGSRAQGSSGQPLSLSLDTACWSPSTSDTLDPSSTLAHSIPPLDAQGLSLFWFSLAPRVGRKAQHQARPGRLQRLPQPPPGMPHVSPVLAVAWLPRVSGGTPGRIPRAELPVGSQCMWLLGLQPSAPSCPPQTHCCPSCRGISRGAWPSTAPPLTPGCHHNALRPQSLEPAKTLDWTTPVLTLAKSPRLRRRHTHKRGRGCTPACPVTPHPRPAEAQLPPSLGAHRCPRTQPLR